jgi:prepilin peptidase CpaA
VVAEAIIGLVLPGLLAYACFSDLFTMKLSNRLCLALAGSFVAFAIAIGMPLSQIGWHLLASLIVFLVVFGLFAAGWVGGGDAKFVACFTLWLGLGQIVEYVAIASLLGGVLTIALLWYRGLPLPEFVCRQGWALHLHDRRSRVPYGIALGTAALMVLPHSDAWRMAF